MKSIPGALAVCFRWLECPLLYQKVTGSIPSQGTHIDCGFKLQSGCVWEATDQCLFLTLMFLSLFQHILPQGLNKHNNILGKRAKPIPFSLCLAGIPPFTLHLNPGTPNCTPSCTVVWSALEAPIFLTQIRGLASNRIHLQGLEARFD